MKTILVPKPHSQIPGAVVGELWWNDQLIGTLYGTDGPGVRLFTKHKTKVVESVADVEIKIEAPNN